jgi:1-acyl-sn-glycerol-3-phosphate acyltransferase
VAPNHASFLDPLVLGCSVWTRMVYLMAVDYHRQPVLNWFYRVAGTIPVEEGRSNRSMMQNALAELRAGRVVAIFPEGGISRDGALLKGNPGVAALILRAEVPVIPVALLGTFEAMPRNVWLPKPRTVRVRFGEPIWPQEWERIASKDRKQRLAAVTDRIMAEIAALQRLG